MHQLTIAGKAYRSRLLVGTGKYKDFAETRAAIDASGAEIVTVAVRRVNIGQDASQPSLLDAVPPTQFTILPNTARLPFAVQARSARRSDQPFSQHAGNPQGRRNPGQGRFRGHGLLRR